MEVRIRYKQKGNSKVETGSTESQPAARGGGGGGGTGGGGNKRDVGEHDGGQKDRDKLLKRMYHFTDEQIIELKETFQDIDRGSTGFIPAHHLGTALRTMGQIPTDSEVQDMLQDAVLDDTGGLSMDEYLRLIGTRGLQTHEELEHDLEEALRYFDKDGRGLIDSDNLKNVLQSYGEPLDDDDVIEMMRMADIKGDGRIDYLELMRKMTLK